jgi:hypothetical protein
MYFEALILNRDIELPFSMDEKKFGRVANTVKKMRGYQE